MLRWLLALVVGLSLFAGSLVAAPVADQALTQIAGIGEPSINAPKLVKVASLADALSPKTAAYAEGDISGCSGQYGWCWVQFCSSWGMGSGGYVTFVTSRYGYTSSNNVYPGYIGSGCNNWARHWFEGNRTGLYVHAGDPVYWISSGQIQT